MGHHNHRTQQTVGYEALEGTLLVAQPPGTMPVIRRYLRESDNSTTDHGTSYVALTGIISTRQIWLWESVVRGTPLEWWRTDRWNRSLIVVCLADVLRGVVIFDDHTAHSKRQFIVNERAGVD